MKALSLSPAKASLLPDALCSRIHNSMQILEEALDKYRYMPHWTGLLDYQFFLRFLKFLVPQSQ